MRLAWDVNGWEDYLYWQAQDKKTLKRVNLLITDALRDYAHGIGKPEPLKYTQANQWSRRIDDANRLVYEVKDGYLIVLQCRYHY